MLELKNVSKRYGTFTALSDLSFQLRPGEIVSLIGQNGAGKSTTFHIILNFIQPTQGTVKGDPDYLKQLGYMPEERGLYPKETIQSQMLYFAALHGMDRKTAKQELHQWMQKLNVIGEVTDKVESLSKGNAQKVQLITCLMFKPKLLILDEPFSGLDPVNAELLIDALLEAKQQGTMIIFSTHNMANVERLSDYIVMLHHGRTILQGTPQDIYAQFGRRQLEIEGYHGDVQQLAAWPGVTKLAERPSGRLSLELVDESVGKAIFREVTQNGYLPVFDQHYPTLDEIFKYEVAHAK
ncbi:MULTISPECIES: ABC transporter ATP-binding protein [Lacticaseibacillus]|uniref:ABC transporter ATP-binding protein n=1 Tax=Lacticaseibacillus TaxID=2759736 RepID=UPI00063DA0A0|nr:MULTISPECIES: ATP-binding cassette domain-containing protein [Lacticaseibacillus]KLI74998.1 sodium ABC transporter ATP-binding protein [Lacticaseibacillus casei]